MRVVLADDHVLFRAGIASLLRAWGMEVVGQAGDGDEALELAQKLRPDLLLMDIGMPGCNGLEATKRIKAELPELRVVIVTVSDEDADLFEAIKAGADGYLLKDMSEDDLSRTLKGIASGETLLSGRFASRVLEEFARLARDGNGKAEDELTPRERDVLELVAAGATNREIGVALYISENTVDFHVKNILHKLHLRNRAQAAAYAVHSGLVENPRNG
jgi:DNA-binding NarL/FixJ family response regulator